MKPILFSSPMVKAILDGTKTMTRKVVKPTYKADEEGFNVITDNATGERWVEKYDEHEMSFDKPRYVLPKYNVGDILWVRETWQEKPIQDENCGYCVLCCNFHGKYLYRADCIDLSGRECAPCNYWKPSIFMPKEAARIFLKIKSVRVERLQDMAPIDAACEGIEIEIPECLKGDVVYPDDFNKYSEKQKDEWIKTRARHNYIAKCEVNNNLLKSFRSLWDSLNAKRGYSWESNPFVWCYTFERIGSVK